MKEFARIAGTVTILAGAAVWSAVLAQAPGGPPPGPTTNNVNGATARTELGFGLFQQRCLNCHGKAEYERAPTPAALREMSPEHIYDVLTHGIMYPVVGAQLSDEQRKAVAESISGRLMGTAASGDAAKMPNRCPGNPPIGEITAGSPWNGWGVDLGNTRYQPAPGLTKADVPKLKLKWAFGFPDGSSAYGQPSVVAGRVFVGADTGYVYALDAKTGCVYWSAQTKAGVRNAMTLGPISGFPGVKYAVFFGDVKANVYALDAQTGRQLWINHVEDHITDRVTAAPALYKGKLYVPISSWEEFRASDLTYGCCTSVGALASLDANTGRTIWKSYVIPERPKPTRKNAQGVQQYGPAGGSVWNTPTVDPKRGAVYVGTGDATTYPAAETSDAAMAFDMRDGKILWTVQAHKNDSYLSGCAVTRTDNCPKTVGPDWDIPGSLVLKDVGGGKRLLYVGTKPGDVLALDPDRNGALVWRKSVNGGPLAGDGPGYPGGTRAGVQWGGAADGKRIYYGLTNGGAAALDLVSGDRVWFAPLNRGENPRANNSAAATAIPGAAFFGGADGKLFAVSTDDGAPLWSFDTARTFETVNKVPAKGGSISAPGPTVAGGMVFVGSGYSTTAGDPGNVILAFAPG